MTSSRIVARNVVWNWAGTGAQMLAGLFLLAGTVLVIPLFFRLFDVPAEQVASVRVALFLIGLNLAVIFPCSVFDATLWAYQRFDLLNLIDIPATVLRVALTVLLVGN